MTLTPSLLHHPPPGVSCGILLLFLFPLISLIIISKRPFLPVLFFYTPFFLSLVLATYMLALYLYAALMMGPWRFFTLGMFAWPFAEALALLAFGAASSFMTALFNLRVRRRAMYPVFPITLALTAAAWVGARRMFELAMN